PRPDGTSAYASGRNRSDRCGPGRSPGSAADFSAWCAPAPATYGCAAVFASLMAGREIQLGEIIIVSFDIRPFGDGKAHVGENRGEFVHHLADRMDAA